jgi:hypothetical protein
LDLAWADRNPLNATLNDPEEASATVMIYGSGVDKIDIKALRNSNVLSW